MHMSNWNKTITILTLVAAIAGTALAAAGFDRLKDHVKVGQGTATDKVFEFDIGAGDDNPTITATSTGDLISTGSGGFVPAGAVMPYAGASAPDGWLLADGSAVSRTTYARLFAAIGTAHGVGDGSTTFNLPDLRGRAVAGKDDMGGAGADRLTSGGSSIDGDTLGAAGGLESRSIEHTHNIAHAHQSVYAHSSSTSVYAQNTADPSNTSFNNGGTKSLLTTGQDYESGSSIFGSRPTNNGAGYTSGVLSPPSGADGATAASGNMSENATLNMTQPTIVLNYIIKA